MLVFPQSLLSTSGVESFVDYPYREYTLSYRPAALQVRSRL